MYILSSRVLFQRCFKQNILENTLEIFCLCNKIKWTRLHNLPTFSLNYFRTAVLRIVFLLEWLQLGNLQITNQHMPTILYYKSLCKYTWRAGNLILSLLVLTHYEQRPSYSISISRKTVYILTTNYWTNKKYSWVSVFLWIMHMFWRQTEH